MRIPLAIATVVVVVAASFAVNGITGAATRDHSSDALAAAADAEATEPTVDPAAFPALAAYAVSMSPYYAQVARQAGFLQGLGGIWLAGGDSAISSGSPDGSVNPEVIFDR